MFTDFVNDVRNASDSRLVSGLQVELDEVLQLNLSVDLDDIVNVDLVLEAAALNFPERQNKMNNLIVAQTVVILSNKINV